MNPNHDYDLARIRRHRCVKDVVFLESVTSTNDWAIEQCKSGNIRPATLVLARTQTHGRGRGERAWTSLPGNISTSLVIDLLPRLLPVSIGVAWPAALSMSVAISVQSVIARYVGDQRATIKWPNDILVDGNKIAGVLIETVAGPPTASNSFAALDFAATGTPAPQIANGGNEPTVFAIIGLGLNVNAFPTFADRDSTQPRSTATSLAAVTGREMAVTEIILELLDQLFREFERFGLYPLPAAQQQSATSNELPHAAFNQRHYLGGKPVAVMQSGNRFAGRCVEVDQCGRLVVESAGEVVRLAAADEISVREDVQKLD